MSCRYLLAFGIALGCWATATAEERAKLQAEKVAHRVWVVADAVLKHHVEPPPRQALLLAAVKGLAEAAKTPLPADLHDRVAKVTSEEQLAALLKELGLAKGDTPIEAAVKALLQAVPGKAELVPADEFKIVEQINENRYVGTGIQIKWDEAEQLTQIVVAIPGGPARKAGAKPGDLIVAVDGVNVKGEKIARIVERLRGEEGTDVAMTVRQPDSKEERTLKLVRSVVPFETAVGHHRPAEEQWSYRVEPNLPVAYVRLNSIRSSTLHELRQLEKRLQVEGDKALVLDLRMVMRGGALHHAGLVADGLLDAGVLWKVRDGQGRVKEVRAERDCLFRDLPLVVLVNPHANDLATTALAAALGDTGRATLVGEPMSCDGYERTFVPLPEDLGQLRLRTAAVERANGTGWTVAPKHTVGMERPLRDELIVWSFEQEKPQVVAKPGAKFPDDPPLAKALELLRPAVR